MKICFLPIDNRPVCYNLAKDIVAIDESIELVIPPRNLLGDLTKSADIDSLFKWLKSCSKCDAMILSLDTIAYGGLIPSRRSTETFEEIKSRIENLKQILQENGAKIYAFSSIMRISNNNYNEEEKEYWSEWGKKIFEYSFNYGDLPYDKPSPQPSPPERKSGNIFHTFPLMEEAGLNPNENSYQNIPSEILQDYLMTRKRNFEINKLYLEWQKDGIFDTLIFSKDDCAESGFNVDEACELERLGGATKTGADEIPLTLLARAIKKEVKVFVEFTEPEYKDKISNYEDVSIEKSVEGQLELAGFTRVFTSEEADIILIVNNFIEKQGELVIGWATEGKYKGIFVVPSKPYAFADVRFANGADNDFIEDILPKLDNNFYGYSGWNTSANTLGTILATIKVKFSGGKYNHESFKKLQMIRFLDDWAYQANVRSMINEPCEISDLMKLYEEELSNVFGIDFSKITYSYPWKRKFEVEVCLE